MQERYSELFKKLKTSGVYALAPTAKAPTLVINEKKREEFCEENGCHVLALPEESKFKQSYMLFDDDKNVEGCIVFFKNSIRLANDKKFLSSDFRKQLLKVNKDFYK